MATAVHRHQTDSRHAGKALSWVQRPGHYVSARPHAPSSLCSSYPTYSPLLPLSRYSSPRSIFPSSVFTGSPCRISISFSFLFFPFTSPPPHSTSALHSLSLSFHYLLSPFKLSHSLLFHSLSLLRFSTLSLSYSSRSLSLLPHHSLLPSSLALLCSPFFSSLSIFPRLSLSFSPALLSPLSLSSPASSSLWFHLLSCDSPYFFSLLCSLLHLSSLFTSLLLSLRLSHSLLSLCFYYSLLRYHLLFISFPSPLSSSHPLSLISLTHLIHYLTHFNCTHSTHLHFSQVSFDSPSISQCSFLVCPLSLSLSFSLYLLFSLAPLLSLLHLRLLSLLALLTLQECPRDWLSSARHPHIRRVSRSVTSDLSYGYPPLSQFY
ncbi:hypothetical protein C7M84_009875 [Penaeus vannamei]|uniref:Uncharacterized protein n=1 Tax=Penaeus vannamei TaxID=6689 RepID=A0A3R7PHE0_PENVA|nr:hypothetical protein C7M84_009875 [Penaeus vannamei]